MVIDKDNPCTKDCPDRPACKGCVRGNEYRAKKIAEYKQKTPEVEFRRYEMQMCNRAFKRAEKFKKKGLK